MPLLFIDSVSISHHRMMPFNREHILFRTTTSSLRSLPIAAARYRDNENPWRKSQEPSKHLLKARETAKHFTTLSPSLRSDEKIELSPNQDIGMVASAQANFMRVVVQSKNKQGKGNGVELLCVVRGLLKKIKRKVLVGDKVLIASIDWVNRRGMIENVYERNSEVTDPPVANVDHYLVLFSMDQPKLEPFTLTRFLVEAESCGIPVTIALNKVELVEEEMLVEWKSRLQSWGYEPLFCSVETKNGLDALLLTLRDRTTVIVGPSGVGKSSLINTLRTELPDCEEAANTILGSKWLEEQSVGEVSSRSGRGKHTTRHVSLLPLSQGGYVADTPGFNQPSLIKVTKTSLAKHFPEVRKILESSETEKCSFSNCLHVGEPGCLVKGDWERFPYYLKLLDEIKTREEFQLRTFGTKREEDVRYKIGAKGEKQAEPRLELKKHRRESRKKMNQSMEWELDDS